MDKESLELERLKKMTNKEAYELFYKGYGYYYNEVRDEIYHFPCDDLNGTFGSSDCNCQSRRSKYPVAQDKIDEKIKEIKEIQEANANLYKVSLDPSTEAIVTKCDEKEKVEQNKLYSYGNLYNKTMFCTYNNIETTKTLLHHIMISMQEDYIESLKRKIQERENVIQYHKSKLAFKRQGGLII